MYVTGFVGFCFTLVVDIHKLDIYSFLRRIGNGPLIPQGTTSRFESRGNTNPRTAAPVGFCLRSFSLVIGFLTLGLVEMTSIPPWETQHKPGSYVHPGTNHAAGEVSDSGITNELITSVDIENGAGTSQGSSREGGNSSTTSTGGGNPSITATPREASRLLIELMSSLETNSALFKPFLVLLTFFSVTNLVTHVVAMAVLKLENFTDLHWWTLVRTVFWFLLAIRLLLTVATITKTLSRIIPHIYYLRSVGELPGAKQEWDDFFQLANSFQFGSRTYGFPLTLNQVASIVAVVNFSFLIVLSLISKTRQ